MNPLNKTYAVRVPAQARHDVLRGGDAVCRWKGEKLIKISRADVDLTEAQWAAFEQSGWQLAVPESEWRSESDARELEEDDQAGRETCNAYLVGRPSLDQNNELQVDVGRVVVKLNPLLSADEARETLSRLGGRIERQLRFAPNLYEVNAPTGKTASEFATIVNTDDSVVYAEPQLIKTFGGR